mmetsp:Transcript_60011/g.123214  ORF Transcript_60011/g.123214 Transcript_60011/m.123214 type:complete len:238 (+) Transcript_60011:61-774(+)
MQQISSNFFELHSAANTLLSANTSPAVSMHDIEHICSIAQFNGRIFKSSLSAGANQGSFPDLGVCNEALSPSSNFLIEDLLSKNREISKELKRSRSSDQQQTVCSELVIGLDGVKDFPTLHKKLDESDDCSSQHDSDNSKIESDNSKNDTEPGAKPKGASKRKMCPWSKEEHQRFLVGLKRFRAEDSEALGRTGKQSVGLGPGTAELIAVVVQTRSAAQVRSHAQKYFQRKRKEKNF